MARSTMLERLAAEAAQELADQDYTSGIKRTHREIKKLGRKHLHNYADQICIFIQNYKYTTRALNNPEDQQ